METDHEAIKYIMTQKHLSRRQARWLDFLQSQDMDIRYKIGKTNVVADALSRKPVESLKFISDVKVQIPSELMKEQEEDDYLGPIKAYLTNPQTSADKQTLRRSKAFTYQGWFGLSLLF